MLYTMRFSSFPTYMNRPHCCNPWINEHITYMALCSDSQLWTWRRFLRYHVQSEKQTNGM